MFPAGSSAGDMMTSRGGCFVVGESALLSRTDEMAVSCQIGIRRYSGTFMWGIRDVFRGDRDKYFWRTLRWALYISPLIRGSLFGKSPSLSITSHLFLNNWWQWNGPYWFSPAICNVHCKWLQRICSFSKPTMNPQLYRICHPPAMYTMHLMGAAILGHSWGLAGWNL